MADISVKTPFSTAARYAAELPTWINEYDAQRIAAYDFYDAVYRIETDTFKLTQRGSEANPIYLPSGRTLVKTKNRYVAKGWNVAVDPAVGTTEQQAAALTLINAFFDREAFRSTFLRNKKWGLVRGDWCFYLTGDPDKPEGRRLSVKAIDPRLVFPIYDETDVDRVLGVDIIEQVLVQDTLYITRETYLKSAHPENGGVEGGFISHQKVRLEAENWETEPKVAEVITPLHELTGITNLPVYHIKNGDPEPGDPWGVSELQGYERIMAAANQSITDEDLAIALEGLGLYKSAKGQPRDGQGNPTQWVLGPGRVVHDETFERVDGIKTVQPFRDHIEFMLHQMYESSGVNDVARGLVDVTVAESGIALKIRMSPLLSEVEEVDTSITEIMNQFLFDLKEWFVAYEGDRTLEAVRLISSLGDKLPEDRAGRVKELVSLASGEVPIVSHGFVRDELRKMGYEIPVNEGVNVVNELQAAAEAQDAYAARLSGELDEEQGDTTSEPGADAEVE